MCHGREWLIEGTVPIINPDDNIDSLLESPKGKWYKGRSLQSQFIPAISIQAPLCEMHEILYNVALICSATPPRKIWRRDWCSLMRAGCSKFRALTFCNGQICFGYCAGTSSACMRQVLRDTVYSEKGRENINLLLRKLSIWYSREIIVCHETALVDHCPNRPIR